jgi:hypothetical protein
MAASPVQTWLNETPSRQLLSEQLRAVGRLVPQELRAQHFPPGFARQITQALRQPGKLLGRPVMRGELLDARDLRGWTLPVLLAAASAADAQSSSLFTLPPSCWRRARAAAAAQEALHSSILTSLGGQFLDLRFEQSKAVDEVQVMEMTEKKAGTLLTLICKLGAMAGASSEQARPPAYIEAIGHFGWHLGVWFQLINDLHGAEQAQMQPTKSDRQRRKKTLPLLLEQRGMIDTTNSTAAALNVQTALSYTYVVAETFRLRARQALQAVEEQFGPHPLLWPLTIPSWEEG